MYACILFTVYELFLNIVFVNANYVTQIKVKSQGQSQSTGVKQY